MPEGEYEGFYSVVVCECGYDEHLEGDVSNGETYECPGCRETVEIRGR